jgi:hypothetical protein
LATSYPFDGQIISIPGAYSTIKSGIKNPGLALGFGNTLLIDTGSGKFFGGAGINGELKSGKNSIFTFDNSRDARSFLRGGLLWLLMDPLFNPGGGATKGVDSTTIIKAATTEAARIDLSFGSSTSDGEANDGSVEVLVNAEGYGGNGVLGNETRAKATITITNAGGAGDQISVRINGELAGTYIVQAGNNIAAVVAGLAAAITANGLCDVFSQSATQIVIYAPRGAADTLNGTPATIALTGTVNGSSGNFSGGVEGTLLTRGYAAKMFAGVSDTSKFIVKFYRGTYKGNDAAGDPYDNLPELSTKAELLCASPELNTVQALINWMKTDQKFKSSFTLGAYTIAATDEITADDLAFYSVYEKANGGTESYSIDDLNDVLDAIADLIYDFILSDNYAANATSVNNEAIKDWIVNTANIKPDMFIGGGEDENEFSGTPLSSVELAQHFDSQNIIVVHGAAEKTIPSGMKDRGVIYKTADVLGRIAGLAPQVPGTFKNLGIDGEVHPLLKKQVTQGLSAGILMTRADGAVFEIVKSINTLQNNTYLVNPDGTTSSIQFGRIARQLNKELTFNLKNGLLKKPNGANRNTVRPEDVKSFVENYLQTKCSTNQVDNILISFNSVEVVRDGDAYFVTYIFEANTEVSFIFATGFVVDSQV